MELKNKCMTALSEIVHRKPLSGSSRTGEHTKQQTYAFNFVGQFRGGFSHLTFLLHEKQRKIHVDWQYLHLTCDQNIILYEYKAPVESHNDK